MDGDGDFDPEVPCPNCDAPVLYSEWESSEGDGETECAKCPECGYVAAMDELFE